jgi:hypothetical protein
MGDLIEETKNGRSAVWLYTQVAYAVVLGTSGERTDLKKVNISTHLAYRTDRRSTGVTMNLDKALLRRMASSMSRNVGSFVVFWLIAFVLVKIGERSTTWIRSFMPIVPEWVAPWAGMTLGIVIGAIIAYKMRAMATTLFLAATFTFAIARFLIQPIFGADAVRGPAYHWGGMTLAVMAVIVGTLMARLAAGRSQSQAKA